MSFEVEHANVGALRGLADRYGLSVYEVVDAASRDQLLRYLKTHGVELRRASSADVAKRRCVFGPAALTELMGKKATW